MEQTNVFIVDFSFKMYVEIDCYHKFILDNVNLLPLNTCIHHENP